VANRLLESGGSRLLESGSIRLLELLFVAAPGRVLGWFEPVALEWAEHQVMVGVDPVALEDSL